ncbi:HNH endonuclease [Pseudomonas kermanshahensis]|uniref:HNH endonuclease n=1 Tax=Pseudomonas kermanshahensis TaxID=2745482 RepID=UPI003B8A5D8D
MTITADDGVKRKTLVHRLVALAFLGPCPTGDHLVRHLDGDGTNNRSANLAWGNELSNFHDAVGHGTRELSPCGQGRVLEATSVREVMRSLALGMTGAQVSALTGVSRSQVSRIKNGRRWRHLTAA